LKNKLKKLIKAAKPKVKKAASVLWKHLPFILLVWLVCRVEMLHAKLDALIVSINQLGYMIWLNLVAAADQFHAAIESILSLFRGDGV